MCDNILPTAFTPCVCRWSQPMVDLCFTEVVRGEAICFHEDTIFNVRSKTSFLKVAPCRQCGTVVPFQDLAVSVPDLPAERFLPGWGERGRDL
jgi:hypothetical protein